MGIVRVSRIYGRIVIQCIRAAEASAVTFQTMPVLILIPVIVPASFRSLYIDTIITIIVDPVADLGCAGMDGCIIIIAVPATNCRILPYRII
jgi:hypothetical protein